MATTVMATVASSVRSSSRRTGTRPTTRQVVMPAMMATDPPREPVSSVSMTPLAATGIHSHVWPRQYQK
ncbi:hypothetical protein COEX109129_42500 [Corallococcus exiguus]